MKQKNLLTTMLLLFALVAGSTSAWAYQATWSGSTALPGSFTNVGNDANVKIKTSSTNTYTSPIRIYANTTITIKVENGYTIESVTYEASSTGNYVTYAQEATVSPSVTPTVSGKNVTWSFSNQVSEFTFKPSSQTRANSITINYSSTSGGDTPDPSISADDVGITYDATGGDIEYTINNPVEGGTVSASVPSGSWLTLPDDFTSPIAFTCSANPTAAARTATVTLTYTYNTSDTETKEVTVTQAGNPNVYNNISEINAVNTQYKVKGTVVATNARGFVIGDGTGYVYTYLGSAPTQSIGDKVTITGTTGTYGQIIQFTSSATVTTASSSNYEGTPAATVITTVPDYSEGYHLSTYLQFEGKLTVSSSNYYITLGDAQIQVSYPTNAQGNTLTALNDKTVRVKGYFSGINSSSKFTVMLESVEEVTNPVLSVDPTSATDFTYEYSYGPSNAQTFTVTGTNLTSTDITVSVTGDYEISADGTTYVSTNLTRSSGQAFSVRLKAGLAVDNYNGTVTIASEGATSVVINLSGSVTPFVEPSITVNNYTINTVAAENFGTIEVTYNKIDFTKTPEVRFYASDGTTSATYDWIYAEIDDDNNIYYEIDANNGEARTAYLKVYGCNLISGDYVRSDLIAITQAAYQPIGTLSNANIYAAGDAANGYTDWTITDGKGKNWYAHAIKNQHSNATSGYHFLQIKKSTTSEACYIHVPDYGRKITSLKMTVSSTQKAMDGGGNGVTLFFSSSNQTSEAGEGVASGSGASSVTIDCSSLNLNTGYITAGGAVRVWDVEVTYEPLKLNSYGYATYASTNPLDFTDADGYTAWKITGVTGSKINFSQITGAVDAETGVFLKGTPGAEVTIINTDSGTDISATNKLVGFAVATNIDEGDYYGLSGNEFVHVNAGNIAGKALLPSSEIPSLARQLTFVFEGESTGIAEMEAVKSIANGKFYNLNGQQVAQPTKGLYIVNGKKCIVK